MLRAAQLESLTDFAVQMHAADDYSLLGQTTLAAIKQLIGGEHAVVEMAAGHFPATRHVHSNADVNWDRHFDQYARLNHEDPVYTRRLRLLLDRPAHDLEFARAADLAKTDLYGGLWRSIGCERVLSIANPGPFGQSILLTRGPGFGFARDDALLIGLLCRHYVAATEQLIARNHGLLPIDGTRTRVERMTWLVAGSDGRILRFKPGAEQNMRLCLGPQTPLDRLPAEWLFELRRREAGMPGTPFRYQVGRRSFSAHVAPIRESPGECSVVFIEYPQPEDPLRPLLALGLTRREAEVLRELASGKSNADIGIALGISALTAKKHVENLFEKIGVTSRAAAVASALTAMQSAPTWQPADQPAARKPVAIRRA